MPDLWFWHLTTYTITHHPWPSHTTSGSATTKATAIGCACHHQWSLFFAFLFIWTIFPPYSPYSPWLSPSLSLSLILHLDLWVWWCNLMSIASLGVKGCWLDFRLTSWKVRAMIGRLWVRMESAYILIKSCLWVLGFILRIESFHNFMVGLVAK